MIGGANPWPIALRLGLFLWAAIFFAVWAVG